MSRTLCWVSQGAASVVAARIELRDNPDAILVRCETNNEDEDNHRFEADCVRWLNRPVTVLRSDEYDSVVDVWERRKFMAGRKGAPCTTHMKIEPRLVFQKPTDIHVFGYTADRLDMERFERLKANFPELRVKAPLIDAGVGKAAALALLLRAGIAPPRTYAMGFPNANCLRTGCSKATSPDYWSLLRHHFPERFAETAERSRRIGARLARIDNQRIYIDEIPDDWPMTDPIAPACDFLCALQNSALDRAMTNPQPAPKIPTRRIARLKSGDLMTIFTSETTIKFEDLDGAGFTDWCKAIGKEPNEIPNLTAEVKVNIPISSFDDDEILERYEEITHPGDCWIERVYRYMAEGNIAAAMDEFSREFGLAPPSHAKAVADLLTSARG